jgi:hypothetical protein
MLTIGNSSFTSCKEEKRRKRIKVRVKRRRRRSGRGYFRPGRNENTRLVERGCFRLCGLRKKDGKRRENGRKCRKKKGKRKKWKSEEGRVLCGLYGLKLKRKE